MLLGSSLACGQVLYSSRQYNLLPGYPNSGGAIFLNNAGQAAGWASDVGDTAATFWNNPDNPLPCGHPAEVYSSRSSDINDLGHIVGSDHRQIGPTDWRSEAFIWSPEDGYRNIGFVSPTDEYSIAYGLNDLDEVVGTYDPAGGLTQAFLWTPQDGMVSLTGFPGGPTTANANDINNHSVVVGAAYTGTDLWAYRWDRENGLQRLPPLFGTDPYTAQHINNAGQIAGLSAEGTAYLFDPVDGYFNIYPPNDLGTPHVVHLNNNGEILGRVTLDGDLLTSYIWDRQRGMRFLMDLLDPCQKESLPPGTLIYPASLNDHGQFVGYFLDYSGVIRPDSQLFTPYIAADPDLDGDTDLADLSTVLTHFGQAGDVTFREGDVDEDGQVDLSDLAHVLTNFGRRCWNW